ncbi:hypothetical protein HDV57DRAFT_482399 [Trichoderma longibrachiatum]
MAPPWLFLVFLVEIEKADPYRINEKGHGDGGQCQVSVAASFKLISKCHHQQDTCSTHRLKLMVASIVRTASRIVAPRDSHRSTH